MNPYAKKPPPPNWKPDLCKCGAPHPAFSHNGQDGPWLCRACYDLPQGPPVDLFGKPPPGRLL